MTNNSPLPRSFAALDRKARIYRVRVQGRRRGYVAPSIGQPGWTAYDHTGRPIANRPTRALAGEILPG
jgi:hypothetical protein